MKRTILTYLAMLFLGTTSAYAGSMTLTTVVPGANYKAVDIEIIDAGTAPSIGATCTSGTIQRFGTQYWFCHNGTWQGNSAPWLEANGNAFLLNTDASAFVGIGTENPTFKLHLAQDGGILAEGTINDGIVESDMGAGTRFMWYPRRAALRAGGVSGTAWNDSNMGTYSVAFGYDSQASGNYTGVFSGSANTVSSPYSTILGGNNNLITFVNSLDESSTIVGGESNEVRQAWGFIGAGRRNVLGGDIGGYSSAIVAGDDNTIVAQGINAFIGAGNNNTAGTGDAVVAGYNNYVNSGLINGGSFIGAGNNNRINNGLGSSAILGGSNNLIEVQYSVIGGGSANNHDADGLSVGQFQAIVGGASNRTEAATHLGGYSFIGGGANNSALGDYNSIPGGRYNSASGGYSTIGGGGGSVVATGNTATANYSTVSGGTNNDATGLAATIAGGSGNISGGAYSFVGGGSGNSADGDYSVAMGEGAVLDNTADRTFVYCNSSQGDCSVSVSDGFILPTTQVFAVGTANPNGSVAAHIANGDLYVQGNIYLDGTINEGTVPSDSDETLKTNIVDLTNSLDKIKQLRGISYNWKRKGNTEESKEIGVIAQDVKRVFPEVTQESRAGTLMVNYGKLIAPLIEAVKELDQKVDSLQKENEDLRQRLKEIDTH